VGQYGLKESLFIGAPTKIGARGVEEVIEVALSPNEQQNLQTSVQAVIELNQAVAKLPV